MAAKLKYQAPKFSDDIKLDKDETVTDYCAEICDALEDFVPFQDSLWWVADVSSDWVVVVNWDDQEQGFRFWQITYSRTEAGFSFGTMDEVEREISVSYEPVKATASKEGGGTEGSASENMSDAVEKPIPDQRKDLPDSAYALIVKRGNGLASKRALPHHINTVKKGSDNDTVDLPRLRNNLARATKIKGASRSDLKAAVYHLEMHASHLKVGRFSKDAVDILNILSVMTKMLDTESGDIDWIEINKLAHKATEDAIKRRGVIHDSIILPKEKKFIDRSNVISFKALDAKQIADKGYPTASPTGKSFLAVYQAGGSIVDTINLNHYLYHSEAMDTNVKRLQSAVKSSYTKGGTGIDLNIKQLIGEVDHPSGEDGPQVKYSCTMLLDIWIDGKDVNFAFGLMDTSVGRDVKQLIEYGMPVATSMAAHGDYEVKVMDSENPYFDGNKNHDGEKYLDIFDFYVDRFDLVVDPASWTYIGAQQDSAPVMKQIKDSIQRLCADGTTPPCSCKTENNITEEKTMNEEALKEALKDLAPEALQKLAPALYDAVIEKGKSLVPVPVTTPIEVKDSVDPRVGALETELRDTKSSLVKTNAELATLRTIVDAKEEEHKKLEGEKALADHKINLESAIEKKAEGLNWKDARVKYLRKALLEDSTKSDATKVAEYVEAANKEFEDTFAQYLVNPEPNAAAGGIKTAGADPTVVYKDSKTNDPIPFPVSKIRRV